MKMYAKTCFQCKHKAQYYLNLFQCFWIIWCFLNVVSLHMMLLRAISQEVRVQPHCSNSLFNIKKHRTNENAWPSMFSNLNTKRNDTPICSNVFEFVCVFWLLFRCIWCRCVQSHRRYEFNHTIQIVYLI